MTDGAARLERVLALAATVALGGMIWPPTLPGLGEPLRVGEQAGEEVRAVDSFLADGTAWRGVEIAAPGLSPERWRDIEADSVAFRAAPIEDRVTALRWPAQIALGQALRVTGRVAVAAPSRVVLSDAFGVEQVSADVSSQAPAFSLSLTPRAPGSQLARLRLEQADGALLDEGVVPVTVVAPTPVRVLVEASAPSFELQALRRWAEVGGTELSMRVRVARERFLQTYVNRDGGLTLEEGDLLILDGRAWGLLEADARERIAQAVEQGLGLLLLADASTEQSDWVAAPLSFPTVDDAWSADEILMHQFSDGKLPALTAAGRRPATHGQVQVLLTDDEGNALASVVRRGAGHVAWLAVTGTHRWVTAGQADAHARLWQRLVQATARPRAAPVIEAPSLAVRDQRTTLCLRGSQGADLSVLAPSGAVPEVVALGADDLGRPCGYYWPRRSGWHTLRAGDAAHGLYVAGDEPWPGVAARRAQEATAQVALVSAMRGAGTSLRLPRAPFLVVFVLLAGVLWWQERRRARP